MRIIVALLFALSLSACASGARPVAMVSGATPDMAPIEEDFTVDAITGGESTNPIWISKVSDHDFKQALILSMQRAGIYDARSDLHVAAELVELKQPLLGFDLTVIATVIYRIKDATGAQVFEETVVSPYTADFSDAFLAVERLQLANEGAVRENILKFMRLLSVNEFAVAGV
jgi:hypothetical protein